MGALHPKELSSDIRPHPKEHVCMLEVNGFTRVHGPAMPPVGFKPTIPVHIQAMNHTRPNIP